ncbi:MAG: anti-sigma regulatory factor [Candidatus Rokubacteria bacterium]|nr:anti-sigma regulatory factor [Candidatus Rokubacteria bacterium]
MASARTLVEKTIVPIRSDRDIVTAREQGRGVALLLGFSPTEVTLIATAISELARNIVLYAGTGEMVLGLVEESKKRGMVIVARDEGPGIADVRRAVVDGYSTSGGLGLGLPGVRRLMDEFDISSELGKGTTVTIRKWKR